MIRFLQSSGNVKKYVLGGMLLIICGAMVITLVPGGILGDAFGFGGVEKGVVAKVNGQDITMTDVEQTARRIASQQFGGRSVPSMYLPLFRSRAAEQLITEKALLAEAERMGLKVSDAELQQMLSQGQFGQVLFPNGKYVGDQQYENFVNQTYQMNIPQFERFAKEQLLLSKLVAAIEGPVSVSKADIEKEYTRQNTKVKFDYAVLSIDDVMKQIKPTEADLKSYYDSHKQTYVNFIPEKRTVKYVVVDNAQVASKVQVSQSDLQSYYRDNQDHYRVPAQINTRHILIKTPLPGPDGKVDEAGLKAAKQKAEDVLKQVKSGGNFAELAKKYSDDPGSKDKGGELGWVNNDQLVPEFVKAAQALKPGETSGLVQSSYGFHIIQLIDKHDAHLKTLDEVKAEIEPIIRQQKAAEQADNMANNLLTAAKTQGIEKAAQSKGLEVMTSNPIQKSDTLPGVGMAPQLMDQIFAAPDKSAPEMGTTPQGSVVFQVTNITPPATPTFEEVRARVESDYRGDKAQQLLGQKMQELADKAKAEHDIKKAAQQTGASFKQSELVTLNSQVPELGRMNDQAAVAFDLPKGGVSGPIRTARGGAVLMVTDKQEPSAEEFAKGSDALRESLVGRKREEAFQIFAAGLRQQMEKDGKIKLNKDAMNQLNSAKPDSGD